jgi:hypothetical protein
MAAYWSAARFRYGFEFDAARAADTPYLRGFCPVARHRRVFHNRVIVDIGPVIAGYVFAEYDRGDAERWHQVAKLPGFVGWLGGEFPEPCRRGVVEDLIARADPDSWLMAFDDQPDDGIFYERGTCCLVALGSEKLRGVVEQMERGAATARVRVFGLFGRELTTDVAVASLTPVKLKDTNARRTFYDLEPVKSRHSSPQFGRQRRYVA